VFPPLLLLLLLLLLALRRVQRAVIIVGAPLVVSIRLIVQLFPLLLPLDFTAMLLLRSVRGAQLLTLLPRR
jgi:hypothetical protein